MRKLCAITTAGIFLLLSAGLTGCTAEYKAPEAVEIRPMTELNSRQDSMYGPVSPVMKDVYDRSISAEVYSTD
ncbi:hypothetical protein [Paenibacillus camerounensis]|uniref:hypothetical protein n=1 Tax=Paenibacillus camerounensis TaxID=1243663 RepID=UPI0005A64573|nr:hypothetical protein [Paenibacillus camerounensis]